MSSVEIDDIITKLNEVDQNIPPWANLIMSSMKVILLQLKNTNEFIAKINELETTVAISKNVTDKLNNELSTLRARVDDNEQRNRNFCLLLHGIEELPNESKTDETVLAVINNDLGVNITIDDIERSHRLGPKNTQRILRSKHDRPRPIIFRFSSLRKRNEVFNNKRKLKGKRISLTENLTKDRYDLYQAAVKKLGKGIVWTVEGRITTKVGNRFIIITKLKDIDDILEIE